MKTIINYQREKYGQILITGKSVSAGYLKNNENTPFITYNGEKAYLTGDLGYIKNGILYFEGRKDTQIKLNGYRIDLLDIEKNILKLEYIENAKVTTKETDGRTTKIIAFVKLKENYQKNEKSIKQDLSKNLPEYMIPNIKIKEKFELTNNGKIDIQKLKGENDGK